MTLKSDVKFEEALTCGLENDRSNLENVYPTTRKSQNWDFDGNLQLTCVSLQFIEELCVMKMRSDAKFEEKLTCGLENDIWNSAIFHQSTQKFQNWDFDGILLSKVENAWA